jgi:hypothetical protein
MTQVHENSANSSRRGRARALSDNVPIATRSRTPIALETRRYISERLRRVLAPLGGRIERASVRLEDVNGPRGGIDQHCRIKVVISGRDSVIVEARAVDSRRAFQNAATRLGRTVRGRVKSRARKGGKAATPPRRRSNTGKPARVAAHASNGASRPVKGDQESLIGGRVGSSAKNLRTALERPEKQRRDAYIDTSAPSVTETDRRAGGPFSARRNSRQHVGDETYALEDSRGKPSRKSTRRSANRTKAATQLERRAVRQTHSSQARAARSQSRGT